MNDDDRTRRDWETFQSWGKRNEDPDSISPGGFHITKRGHTVLVILALTLLVILMAFVGGIEQGTL